MNRPTRWTRDTLIEWGVYLISRDGAVPSARHADIPDTTIRREFGTHNAFKEIIERIWIDRGRQRTEAPSPAPQVPSFSGGVPGTDSVHPRDPVPHDGDRPTVTITHPPGHPDVSAAQRRIDEGYAPAVQLPQPVIAIPKPMNLRNDVTIFVPDIHFPFHDPVSLEIVKQAIAHYKPRRVVQLGDMLDCACFSSHDGKTPDEMRNYDFEQHEIEPAREFMRFCLQNCGELVIILGNHEYRIERWVIKNGLPGYAAYNNIRVENLLGANALGVSPERITFLPYQPEAKDAAHGFWVSPNHIAVHGWSYAEHAAAQHLRIARTVSIAFGHTHRRENKTIREPMTGTALQADSFGTLSKLQPLYAVNGQPTTWVNGFGIRFESETNPNDWELNKPMVQNGRAIVDGGLRFSVN